MVNYDFHSPRFAQGSFGLVLLSLLAGLLEFTVWSEDYATKEPGNSGEPLGLKQYTEDGREMGGWDEEMLMIEIDIGYKDEYDWICILMMILLYTFFIST